MTLRFLLLLLLLPVMAVGQNLNLLGHLTYQETLSDVWGYAKNGREYAFVGVRDGVSIVDVTDPANPIEIAFYLGVATDWRDIYVWNDHAYVVNEGGLGLLIIDLAPLPAAPTSTAIYVGNTYNFSTAHNLFISDAGICYILGSSYGNGGVIVLDLTQDPMAPVEVTVWDDFYVHDATLQGDYLWVSLVFEGQQGLLLVENPATPTLIATWDTPGQTAHNAWPSDDGNYLFTTDEIASGHVTSYDITDLSNPTELDRYRTDPGQQSSPHNAHFLNDYLFVSYYQDGLVILDVTQPRSLSRVAQFDTHPGSGGEFDGCWGAYPYLPSGNILVTDVQSGLYILDFQETRAAYVQGTVKANIDGNPPVWNPLVNVLNSPEETYGDLSGNFAFALSPGGIYDLQVSHPFYESKTIPVNLTAGEVENLTILLDPLVDGVEEARESGFTLFPNPAQTTEAIIIQGPELPQNVHLLDALGRIQATAQPTLSGALIWNKQPAAGTYWIVLNFQNGDAIQQQLILLD